MRDTAISCDLEGCDNKNLGQEHDHVHLVLTHYVAAKDLPEGTASGSTVDASIHNFGNLDFCSWDHAGKYLKDNAKEAKEARTETIDRLAPQGDDES